MKLINKKVLSANPYMTKRKIVCGECEKQKKDVVSLSSKTKIIKNVYDYQCVWVCKSCLKKALALLDK